MLTSYSYANLRMRKMFMASLSTCERPHILLKNKLLARLWTKEPHNTNSSRFLKILNFNFFKVNGYSIYVCWALIPQIHSLSFIFLNSDIQESFWVLELCKWALLKGLIFNECFFVWGWLWELLKWWNLQTSSSSWEETSSRDAKYFSSSYGFMFFWHNIGCGEYFVEYCQSHITLLWICIMLWNRF